VKTCTKCQESKPYAAFSPAQQCRDGYRPECKACHNAIEKARDKSHRVTITREYKREERFRRLYGITLEDYDVLFAEQGGLCAVCREPQSWNRREGDVLVVDHDHLTGAVRGLLCHACNQAIGLMKDDSARLIAAAAYLSAHREAEECAS
jgi:hypothetical protein